MRKFTRSALATALLLGVSAPVLAQFNGIYAFGDSLSDAGFYGARFTVNPGLVWAQDLGQSYGFTVKPVTQGGTDFAQGGQRVTQPSADTPAGAPQRPLSTQIDELLKVSPSLNPNAIYTVWIGANDLRAAINGILTGQITSAQAATEVGVAATQTVQQIARLKAAGAQYVIVGNMPDFGKTPGGSAFGPVAAAGASQLSSLFNSTLNVGLGQTGIQVIPLNTFALFNEILANPAAYGFANVTKPACTTSSAISCTTSTLVAPNAAETYLFADDIHPTPAAHAIIAQVAESILRGPQQIAVLAEAPLAVEEANWRTIDGRMMSGANSVRPAGKFEAWAAYDYSNPDIDSGYLSGDATVNTLAVGGDIRLSEHLLAGAAASFAENKGDLGGGGYKLKQTTATVYAGYGHGPWYVGATLGGGDLDYSDVHRDIKLGAATRTERGDTRGYTIVGRVLGGYWFTAGDWVHGPFAKYTYQEVKVRGFQEQGTNSTTLAYDEQKRNSSVATLGWQVNGRLGSFRPYGRVTWEYEMENDVRSVGASVYGLNGRFSVPGYSPDKDYVQFSLGAATDIGRVTVYLTGSGTTGKSDGDSYAITAGVRLPL